MASEAMNNLGLTAVALTAFGGIAVAYIGRKTAKDTTSLTHEDTFRASLQEQINSLSKRLESEIEHRNDCEEEKTAMRLEHDKEVEALIKEHRIERHNFREFMRKQSTFIHYLIDILKTNGILVDDAEVPRMSNAEK